MSLPDATAGAQLTQSTFQVAWMSYLDFSGMPLRITSAPFPIAFTGTGDTDIDGFTFSAVNPAMIKASDVKNAEGGSETVSFTLSGIVGPNTDLLNVIGDPSLWRTRSARIWGVIYNEVGTQQGAIWHIYTGRMSAVQMIGDPSAQTVKLDVEGYLASLKQASGRTYLDQAQFDPVDITARLKIGAANGATKGVNDGSQAPINDYGTGFYF